jgi:hypothetical protein
VCDDPADEHEAQELASRATYASAIYRLITSKG